MPSSPFSTVTPRPLASVLQMTLVLVLAGCASTSIERSNGDGVFAVPGDQQSHHRLRFADGQVSPNDSCMVKLGNRLNREVPPLYVNGLPMAFC